MSGLDHTDRLLSANRTQESFLYSTATPNSSNGDILGASRTGPVNRFEHLLNSASRRSQIEQVVADDMDEDYIESTQVDMCCLDATQVDSPVVRNLSVTEIEKYADFLQSPDDGQEAAEQPSDSDLRIGLGCTPSQSAQDIDDRIIVENNLSFINGNEQKNVSDMAEENFVFIAPVGRSSAHNDILGALRLGVSQSQSQPQFNSVVDKSTAIIKAAVDAEDTPSTQEVSGNNHNSAHRCETAHSVLRFGFTQSQSQQLQLQYLPRLVSDADTVDDTKNEYGNRSAEDYIREEADDVPHLGLGITQTQGTATSQIILSDGPASDMIISDEISLGQRDFQAPIVEAITSINEKNIDVPCPTATVTHTTSMSSPVIRMNSNSSCATRPQLSSDSLVFSQSNADSVKDEQHPRGAISVNQKEHQKGGLKFSNALECPQPDRNISKIDRKDIDNNAGSSEGWVESRRYDVTLVASQTLNSLAEDLLRASPESESGVKSKMINSGTINSSELSDPSAIQEQLRLMKELLKQKELEIEALKNSKEAPVEFRKGRNNANQRADMTPLGIGLGSSRTPATIPQYMNPTPNELGAAERAAQLMKKKRVGRHSPNKISKSSTGNFDFEGSFVGSNEDTTEGVVIPDSALKPLARNIIAGTPSSTAKAADLVAHTPLSKGSHKRNLTSNGEDSGEDDETPMKEIIRQRRKKEKLQAVLASRLHQEKAVPSAAVPALERGPNKSPPTMETRLNATKEGQLVKGVASDKKKYPADLVHVEEAEWNSQADFLPPLAPPRSIKTPTASSTTGIRITSPGFRSPDTAPTLISPADQKGCESLAATSCDPDNIFGFSDELLKTLQKANVPIGLFTSDFYDKKAAVDAGNTADLLVLWKRLPFFKTVWKILEKAGWKYTKGKELIDYYYLRPDRNIPCGFEDRDYFISHEQLLKYIIQYEVKCLDFFKKVTEEEISSNGEIENCNIEQRNDDNGFSSPWSGNNQGDLSAISMLPKGVASEVDAAEVITADISIGTLINLMITAKWADLRPILLAAGWTWIYGTGLVSVWYFRPGITKHDKDAVVGVDKHADEETVRSYLLDQMSKKVHDDATKRVIEGLRALAIDEGIVEEPDNFPKEKTDKIAAVIEKQSKDVVGDIRDNNSVVNPMERILAFIESAKWSDLWAALMTTGWSWDYGSGLVNVWYFRPGFSKQSKGAVEAIDKHSSEDTVRSYIRSQLTMSVLDEHAIKVRDELLCLVNLSNAPDQHNVIDDCVWPTNGSSSKSSKSDDSDGKKSKKRSRRSSHRPKSSKRHQASPRSDRGINGNCAQHPDDSTQPQRITDYDQYGTSVISSRQQIQRSPKMTSPSRSSVNPQYSSPVRPLFPTKAASAAAVEQPLEASPQKRLFTARRLTEFDDIGIARLSKSGATAEARIPTGMRSSRVLKGSPGSAPVNSQRYADFNTRYLTNKVSPKRAGLSSGATTPCRYVDIISSNQSDSLLKDRKLEARQIFKGVYFILTGMDEDIRVEISRLIDKSGGKQLHDIDEIEKLFERAGNSDQPNVVAIGHPTKFRRVKYIMALAKAIPLVHYSWVYACLTHVQHMSSTSSHSHNMKVLPLSYENFLLPSGASFLHPYYVFTANIPEVGTLGDYLILNLAGDVWDPVLRAAGAEVCSKFYPSGVSSASAHRRSAALCPHTAKAHPMDSLSAAGTRSAALERMNAEHMLDWYCCSCEAKGVTGRSVTAVGKQYNTSSLSSKTRQSNVHSRAPFLVNRPTLILFDPYTICENKARISSNYPFALNGSRSSSTLTPELLKESVRSAAATGGSISAFSPNESKVLSPEADTVLCRLHSLSAERLNFIGDSGACPPRVVSIDWVVHIIGLGEFIPYDASINFSLPTDVMRHPIVVKSGHGGDDRYILDDVVFYSVNKVSAQTINPFQSSGSLSRTSSGKDAELRMGRIMRFDCIDGGITLIKVRPLYFHKKTLTQRAFSECLPDTDDITGQISDDSDSSFDASDREADDDGYSSVDENSTEWGGHALTLQQRVSFLKEEYISKDQLSGRPVIISAAAYNDLEYPHFDPSIYASTEFYESCYDGSEYRRSKKRLKSWQRRCLNSGAYCANMSQDY